MHLLFAKAQTILFDFFRCVICVCFPPNFLVAAALFTAQFLLKIQLTTSHLTPEIRAKLVDPQKKAPGPESAPGLELPYKALFAVDKIDIVRISEFYLQYLKVMKSLE